LSRCATFLRVAVIAILVVIILLLLLAGALVGLSSVLAGLTISYYGNLPPGGTIVLTATGFFLVATVFEAVRARV